MGGKRQKYLTPLEYVLQEPLPKLEEADIVVIRIKKNFLRYLIRKVTNSYWDHCALVLYPKNTELGIDYNMIIEAAEPKGIEVHKLNKYLNAPEKYEVGIKRVANLDAQTRERIISFMLLNVDAPYYPLKRRRFLMAMISKKYSEKLLGRQRYCCSGFVQKAFYDAVNWDKREKIIFRREFLSPIELQDITTPGDIAGSTKSDWLFNKH